MTQLNLFSLSSWFPRSFFPCEHVHSSFSSPSSFERVHTSSHRTMKVRNGVKKEREYPQNLHDFLVPCVRRRSSSFIYCSRVEIQQVVTHNLHFTMDLRRVASSWRTMTRFFLLRQIKVKRNPTSSCQLKSPLHLPSHPLSCSSSNSNQNHTHYSTLNQTFSSS